MPTPTGLALLRLLPALNSTVILMFAFDEYLFLSRWMKPTYRAQANALLAPWFAYWLSPALYVIVGSFSFSFAIALANIFTSRAALQAAGAEKWYWCGFVFQLAHFLYAPAILPLLKAITRGPARGQGHRQHEEMAEDPSSPELDRGLAGVGVLYCCKSRVRAA
jgi:hypothetical protein